MSEGDLEILDYNSPSASARIKVRTDGQVADVLRLIDQQPLGYTKRFGIDPATTRGTSTINLDFAIPLLKDVPVERVGVGVQARVAGISIAIDERRRLENGTAQIALDTKSLTSQGTGDVSGVPVSFRWQENFEAQASSTRIDLTGRLDDASRAKLGLSEPTWLKGAMPVQVTFTGHRFALTDATVRADMTQAFAEYPMFNLAKRAGTPATGTARVHFSPQGTDPDQRSRDHGPGIAGARLGLAAGGWASHQSVARRHARRFDQRFRTRRRADAGRRAFDPRPGQEPGCNEGFRRRRKDRRPPRRRKRRAASA